MSEDVIRYYKGIYKLRRISKGSPMKTALYDCLEDNPGFWNEGDQICAPYRICTRDKLNDTN